HRRVRDFPGSSQLPRFLHQPAGRSAVTGRWPPATTLRWSSSPGPAHSQENRGLRDQLEELARLTCWLGASRRAAPWSAAARGQLTPQPGPEIDLMNKEELMDLLVREKDATQKLRLLHRSESPAQDLWRSSRNCSRLAWRPLP
uniref:Coiled-coil domain-containing protein 24 n=1 Tax=Macrostomum lignano TaxID=282301 RepID=A0A1I8F7M5_9PLAT